MPMDAYTALVTGGAGFIGSHLVGALLNAGARVKVIDNLSTGNLQNLDPFRNRIDFIEGDIRSDAAVTAAVGEVDWVFHQAAVVSVPLSVADPIGSAEVNEMGTLKVLEASRKGGVDRVVLASSSAVYGDDPTLPKCETMPPGLLSPYAAQKLTNEHYAGLYHRLYGLDTVCLRYFNVFGPRQDPSSPYSGVISIFMERAASGAAPVIYGDGEQSRDFVYVEDVARANLAAAVHPAAPGKIFNVGTGHAITVNRLWERVRSLAGVDLEAAYADARDGDIRHSLADIAGISETLDFQPAVAFDDGLQQTFAWYQAGRDTPQSSGGTDESA